MKITIICDVLGKENNGTTIAAFNLIRFLKSKGHTVTVVCADSDKKGIPGYRVVPTVNFGIFNHYVASNGVTVAHADEAILRDAVKDADVVHLLVPFFMAMQTTKLAKELQIPLTASFHCQAENFSTHFFLMNNRQFNRSVYGFFYRHVYRYCDAVHYPTQFICDVFEQSIGHKTNHYIISNGVNKRFVPCPAEKPPELQNAFVILFTGRYSREKSQHVLIEAVAKSKYADRIRLILAGCGPTEKQLRAQAEKLLVNPVTFHFFGRDEMLSVLNYADLYVHPAEIEIEAISCLEAITCGLVPVIADSPRSATKAFALTEHNLFHYNNAESLAEQIDYWIEHPEEKAHCREQYRGFCTQFDQDACMEAMERMLTDAARKKNHKEPML